MNQARVGLLVAASLVAMPLTAYAQKAPPKTEKAQPAKGAAAAAPKGAAAAPKGGEINLDEPDAAKPAEGGDAASGT